MAINIYHVFKLHYFRNDPVYTFVGVWNATSGEEAGIRARYDHPKLTSFPLFAVKADALTYIDEIEKDKNKRSAA